MRLSSNKDRINAIQLYTNAEVGGTKQTHTVRVLFDGRLTRTFDNLNEAENYQLALNLLIREVEENARVATVVALTGH